VGKIVNFHLPADDVDRAAKFYREVFGWEFVASEPSAVPYLVHSPGEHDGAGIPAAITRRQDIVKAPTPTIEMKGGQQGRVQDIPGIGRFGYAIDSEGNVIALLEPLAASS
jgi:hypothetical protein